MEPVPKLRILFHINEVNHGGQKKDMIQWCSQWSEVLVFVGKALIETALFFVLAKMPEPVRNQMSSIIKFLSNFDHWG